MLTYINLTDRIMTDKHWERLKSFGKNYDSNDAKMRYDWTLDYFEKWKIEMIPTLTTLILCINRLCPSLQNLIPEMMLLYKRMIMNSMSTDFTYCDAHKGRVDRCEKCRYIRLNYCEHSTMEKGPCWNCQSCVHDCKRSECSGCRSQSPPSDDPNR